MKRAIGITITATFIGQVLNFFVEILIASKYGTGWKADAYFLSLLIPTIVCDLLIVIIGSTFIPIYISRQKTGDAQSFFISVTNLTAVLTFCIGAIVFFIVPSLISLIAKGFSAEARELTIALTRTLIFLIVIMPVSALLSNLLNAHNHFVLPSAGKSLNFLCIILSILFFIKIMDIFSLAFGYITGALLFLALQMLLLRKIGIQYSASFHIRHPALKEVGILILPILLAAMANYINIFIERSIAAGFSEGSIASLSYAFKVLNVPVNALILPAMTVILPAFSKYAADGDMGRLEEFIIKGLKFISFLIVPVTVGILLVRIPLIKMLFERGRFTAQSTGLTAYALLFYAFGIIGLSVITLLNRVFYVLKDLKTQNRIGIIIIALNIVLILILSKRFGFMGIPLTFSITSTIHMAIMLIVLEKMQGMNLIMPFLKAFTKHALSSGVMMMVCLLFMRNTDFHSIASVMNQLLYFIFLAAGGAISYFLTSMVLRVDEVDFFLEKFKALRALVKP